MLRKVNELGFMGMWIGSYPLKKSVNFKRKVRAMGKNSLNKIRESLLMSKAELARKANVSPITIARIENGQPCRMETKRKILLALGYKLTDKHKIFGE